MSILDNVNWPDDVKNLSKEELAQLCDEIRSFLIDNVSKTGGHLASNLGVVELTVALHRVFDTDRDRLIFDVGHQCYVHKMLTGRKDRFGTLRQYGGLAGFPKPTESVHDAAIAGHASGSISLGLGMARARTLADDNYSVVAVIGDGALTGGLAYEALCDAGASGEPLIIILNDNGMSIKANVGGMARYLSRQRVKPSYLSFKKRYRNFMNKFPGGKAIYRVTHGIKTAIKMAMLHCSMFEEMGLQYAGPVDGYNIAQMESVMRWAKEQEVPTLVHVITQKGKGYVYAEDNPDKYHGVSKFNLESGIPDCEEDSFSSVFGNALVKFADADPKVCAITAAMASGTGLDEFAQNYPKRFFDVGIAEGHGAVLAAGMADRGMLPVFAVYSTFLQRSYDMLIHDIAISGLHVILAVDRAGLVGQDGETHHGVFDVAYLTSVPGLSVFSPANYCELREMMDMALYEVKGPVAVRYPRGGEGRYTAGGIAPAKCVREGTDYTVVTYGISVNTALDAGDKLQAQGVSVEIIKLDLINPIDYSYIIDSVKKTKRLLVLEECAAQGCIGTKIAEHFACAGIAPEKVILKNIGTQFVSQGENDQLRKLLGIDADSVAAAIMEDLADE